LASSDDTWADPVPGNGSFGASDVLQWPKEEMAMSEHVQKQKSKLETVEPLGKRVLIRKDEDKKVTKGGIELPDSVEIPTITGRIVAVSAQVANDEDFPIRQYDRVLFNPKHAIPVEFDADNFLYVVPIEDVVAVFRKGE
jgi:chaperonin GroES